MIQVDISKCTGCRACETTCSFYHTGKINRSMARIKVTHLYTIGIDSPLICVQCVERYCLDCPENAISVGLQGQVVICPTLCTLCGKCEKRCPIGAIELFNGFVYVCDLCGGTPKCIEACTEEAITYSSNAVEKVSLAEIMSSIGKKNPSEKRMHYINKMGTELREKWREKNA
ncbi:MAG: 4Fe-4S dicluster domain-containing protein [Candidatus Hodarchaeota archaeon]